MAIKTRVSLLAAWMIVGSHAPALLSQPLSTVEQAIVDEVSGEEMLKLLELVNTLDRNSGSPGEFEALAYIKERLAEYGVATTSYTFDSYLSWPISGSLEVDGETIDALTVAFGADGSVEAEMVFVGSPGQVFANLDPSIYEGKEVRGKIVVADGMLTPQHALLAEQQGAVGLIHINDGELLHEMIATTIWGTPTIRSQDRLPNIPMLSLRKSDGERLKERANPPRGRITARVDTRWRPIELVVAEVRGRQDPGRFVLVSGHIDGWHKGVTDNGTANATMLEMARVFQKHRDQLTRSVRFAWWPGHSTGRYSGSQWYADHHWDDLYYNGIANMNIDGNGIRGADIERVMAGGWPVLQEFSRATVGDVTGKSVAEGGLRGEGSLYRPFRAGDSAFQGIGMPSISGGIPGLPAEHPDRRPYVGGSGGGWWWHGPEDTLDKVDMDVLVRDSRIRLALVMRLANAPMIPYRFTGLVSDFRTAVTQTQEAARDRFDLSPLLERLRRLRSLVRQIDGVTASKLRRRSTADPRVDHNLLRLSRILHSALYTELGPYEQDFAGPLPILPSLHDARRLATMDPASDEFGFLKAHLIRERNRIAHALDMALERADLLRSLF